MNSKLHIMQGVDWTKYDLPEWLRQFGYWQGAMIRFGGSTENPLVGAIKKAKLRLKKGDREKIVAYYMCDENFIDKHSKKPNVCLITDDEARAVQRLIIDILDGCTSEAMLDWMDAIIERYFNQKSWTQLVNSDRTAMDAKYDVRCGLAALHNRYQFIEYKNGSV
ncbi:hypothetical protein APD36_06485 [Acinetobacter pittii]|uniref:hypothetical protein n=1 Tax=Acinetobacter pittii TaxID=48296 RepID=UPI0007074B8B|nr:hypothetical protein [Acinetobacter pittii]KQE16765.1 hypothetical protein APD36_06485 [Acinetobacter pittii]MDV8151938.1 hypothetical protein [Acinetobacter pittii]